MKAFLGSQLIQREVRSTVVFSACCLACVLLLCATGLYPVYVKGNQLDKRINELHEERDIQLRLQPFFISLMTVEDAIECSPDLAYAEKRPLPRKRLLNFDKRIMALAKQFEMETLSVDVKMDEIRQGDFVAVNACLVGDFINFRRFLLNLGQVAWVHDFESLSVGSYRNQEQLNVQFKLALE